MRCGAGRPRPSTAAEAASLSFVGDSQTLPAPGTAPFQDDPTIFRRHAYPEAVRFLAPTGIGLVGALPLHGVLCACLAEASLRRLGPAEFGELSILVVAQTECQRRIGCRDLVLHSPLPIYRSPLAFASILRFVPQDFHNCGKHCGKRRRLSVSLEFVRNY